MVMDVQGARSSTDFPPMVGFPFPLTATCAVLPLTLEVWNVRPDVSTLTFGCAMLARPCFKLSTCALHIRPVRSFPVKTASTNILAASSGLPVPVVDPVPVVPPVVVPVPTPVPELVLPPVPALPPPQAESIKASETIVTRAENLIKLRIVHLPLVRPVQPTSVLNLFSLLHSRLLIVN